MLFHLKQEGNPIPRYSMDDLEDIMVSEISPSHKDKFCMTPAYEGPRGAAFTEAGSRKVVAGAGGQGTEHCCFMGMEFQSGDEAFWRCCTTT